MLTPKQEKFVQNLIRGMSQREAYKKSYNASKMKDETIDSKASNLFKEARYEELIKKADDEAIMSAIERKKWLTKVINGETEENIVIDFKMDETGNVKKIEQSVPSKLKTRLMALDVLNKMDGEYIEKVKVSGNISHQEQKNAIDDVVAQMKFVSDDDV